MHPSNFICSLFSAFALLLGLGVTSNGLRSESSASAAAEATGDATAERLNELDRQIDQLDALEGNAPTQAEKETADARIKILKERRRELRKNYAQARYDELKADVKNEYNRLLSWTKTAFAPNAQGQVGRKLDNLDAKAKNDSHHVSEETAEAQAAANPATVVATADRATYKAKPSEETKAEVRASLAVLDVEIGELETRIESMPASGERVSMDLRLKALKERRSELGSDFRRARYDALKADVKSEWTRLTH